MARTKANNHGVKIKDKETKTSTCHDNPAINFIANFPVYYPTEFPLTTALLELSAPLIRSTLIQIHFYWYLSLHVFFISNAFFSTQPQCFLTFSWIELRMLLRCCLINENISILRHFWYSLYLCPCLEQGLFMLHLCDPCDFICIFIFIMINHMNTETLALLLLFQNMSYYI